VGTPIFPVRIFYNVLRVSRTDCGNHCYDCLRMNASIRKKTTMLKRNGPKVVSPFVANIFFASLFSRLKERPEDPQTMRVEHILDLLCKFGEGPGLGFLPLLKQLGEALSCYRWGSRVSYSRKGLQSAFIPADAEGLTAEDVWEHEAVSGLLWLTQDPRLLSRIRRCKNKECQRLFFAANRTDQEFHAGKCRQYFYDSDEGTRAKKRKYMRKYYEDQKDRARNPKSGIGLERRTSRSSRKTK